MTWTTYFVIFFLSFAVSVFAPHTIFESFNLRTGWTGPIPALKQVPPALVALSGIALTLAVLFLTLHVVFALFGDTKLRRAGGRVLKAALFERACRVLRAVLRESSSSPQPSTLSQEVFKIPSAVEVFDFWMACVAYYVLVSGVQAVVLFLLRCARRATEWRRADADEITKTTKEATVRDTSPSPSHLDLEPSAESTEPSTATPRLYTLSVFGHFSHSRNEFPTSRTGTPQHLYTTSVDVSKLSAIDLVIHIHGVEHALPNLDLRAMADMSMDHGGAPVQVQLPLSIPLSVEPSDTSGEVVISVVLWPAREDDDNAGEGGHGHGDGDEEEVDSEFQDWALALLDQLGENVPDSACAQWLLSEADSEDTSTLPLDETDKDWGDDVDVFSLQATDNTTGAFIATYDGDSPSLSISATNSKTAYKGPECSLNASEQKYLDALQSLSAIPPTTSRSSSSSSSSISGSSSISCLSSPSPSKTSLRPLDSNAPVFVPRTMRLEVRHHGVGSG